jgi:hypothetical protein
MRTAGRMKSQVRRGRERGARGYEAAGAARAEVRARRGHGLGARG